jgi:agmatinase
MSNDPQFDPNAAAQHEGIFGLPYDEAQSKVVLVPVPFDATTSYRGGTADGPAAILEASWQVDLHDVETGDPWRTGIYMMPISKQLEELNVESRNLADPIKLTGGADADPKALARVNEISEHVRRWVHDTVKAQLDAGKIVGLVGGDHSCPLGAIEALGERTSALGILHIDAHADLRDRFEGFSQSHASIMRNVLERVPSVKRLVQVGVRDLCEAELRFIEQSEGRVVPWFDSKMADDLLGGSSFAALVDRMLAPLPRDVWVSFDIDGLEPSLCPSTGTPVPGGLTFHQACFLLRMVVQSGHRIRGFDLCEVTPGPEGSESIDAIVGARILYKLIGWAVRSGI